MRGGRGGSNSFRWALALCATWACSGAARVHPEPPVPATACALTDTPSTVADSSTITFTALGATREQCAFTLIAATLRPWPTATSGPWTVHIGITPTAAVARRVGGEGARNAIDAGSALIATDDIDLTTYAATRADLEVTPLPWDRTYVRLSPRAAGALGADAGPDAVRADARVAEAPACELFLPEATANSGSLSSKRVVYAVGDRTARELAERTVALAARSDATAVGLTAAELDFALRAGTELAYVVSVSRVSYCETLAALAQHTPWMSAHSVLPLIDTRAYAIAPRAPRP
jgi:hypothetical protein